jgi:hypothetical protein
MGADAPGRYFKVLNTRRYIMSTQASKRPFGVTILSIAAWVAAFLAFVHVLQSLGILPFFIGRFVSLEGFNLWSALMWALMVWVWVSVAQMLWNVNAEAWIFLTVIAVFNLVIDFTYLIGKAEWTDVSVNFIVSALILIYCLLPGVKKSFNVK